MAALKVSIVSKGITENNTESSAGMTSSSSTGYNHIPTVAKWQAQTFSGYKAPSLSASH